VTITVIMKIINSFIFISVIGIHSLHGQLLDNSKCKPIEVDVYDGVIFGKGCAVNYEGTTNRFEVELEDIKKAEQELLIQVNIVLSSDNRVQGHYQIKNPKKHFKKFKRQYFGYIEPESNDKILYINLLNFSGIGTPKQFKGWKNGFIIGFGKFYEKNLSGYEYNLTTNKLRIP